MGHAAHVSSICELHLPQSPQQAAYKRQRIRDGENLECRNATARASVTVASYSPRLARPGHCQSLREEEEEEEEEESLFRADAVRRRRVTRPTLSQ